MHYKKWAKSLQKLVSILSVKLVSKKFGHTQAKTKDYLRLLLLKLKRNGAKPPKDDKKERSGRKKYGFLDNEMRH